MDGCSNRREIRGQISCSTNVRLGREGEPRLIPADKPKKVAIIGGGPAGLEAARVATLRGHRVSLYEKRKMGGWLIEASIPDFKADFRNLTAYLVTQLTKLGVSIVNQEASAEDIAKGGFDAIIVATGSKPIVPRVRGIDKPIVIQAVDVLAGAKTGENIIVVGGGYIGCETALYLCEQGKKVTIVEMLPSIAADMDRHVVLAFFERLNKTKYQICVNTRLEEITGNGIVASDKNGTFVEIKGDTVVLALGMEPNDKFSKELEKTNIEFIRVGDCVEPRHIHDAMHEGYAAAQCI